jgi:hypothetical protein
MLRQALVSIVSVSALILLPVPEAAAQVTAGAQKVDCQWGAAQKMDAIPGCGVPRQISVTSPAGVERLMFARDDNPTLTRYLYRGRAIGAPVKPFKRMVNVTKTDLVVCPSDFQKARILSFRVLKGRMVTARPTCELGPPSQAMVPPMAGMADAMQPGPAMAAMGAGAMGAGAMGARSVTNAIEKDNPVRQQDLVKLRRAIKMDSLARLLGLLGLLLGLGGVVGVVILALTLRRRVQRLERDLDRRSSNT